MELVKHLDAEIVSADAVQVYRGLDLGSAKPDRQTLNSIKHHLIDICPPNEVYSAGRYIEDATQAVLDILARGKTPLIAGGAMFYIKSLLEGLNQLPPADEQLRESYLNKYADLSAEDRATALHEELRKLDAATAARTNPADGQRVLRALELIDQSGTTLDELFDSKMTGLKKLAEQNSWHISTFALNYKDRALLREKIAIRFHQFIESGLIDEVRQLRLTYPDLNLSLPAVRAIGYRQVWEYLQNTENKAIEDLGDLDNIDSVESTNKESLRMRDAMIEKVIIATRQFAKRQMTWLRNWGDASMHHLDASLAPEYLAKQVLTKINSD